jgi:mercuric reductase
MVERSLLGGTCVNVGCVPSKNLLGAGELLYSSDNPSYSSISPCYEQDFDFSRTIKQKDNLVRYLRKQKYYDVLSSLENVQLIEGNASFLSANKIKVNNNSNSKTLEAKKFIVATGSSASVPLTIKGIDNVNYITNIEALSLDKKPSSMIVIGGRALGLEFAQMYSRFGNRVTILQRSNTIIPEYEPEVSSALMQYLSEEGVNIITGIRIQQVYQKNDTKYVRISVGNNNNNITKTLEAEELLMATGRRPNTQDLHLENTDAKLRPSDGAIIVDSEMHTSASNIWAGGDVIGEPMLEALAAKEGATAADNALTGSHKKIDFLSVPSAIFTSPQVASVGLTEKRAMERYGVCDCRTLEMNDVPKALIINETKGLIKMVVDPNENNRIVGVHILANIAADMIHEAVIAVKYQLTIDDIIDTIHIFPTMTEAIKLAATAFKQDISKLSCCAE